MKTNFDRKIKIALISLVALSLFAGISCISAADIDSNNNITDSDANVDINIPLTMTVPQTAGTGYHWEVSPETYGVDIGESKFVEDHPGCVGSSGTNYFSFHINSDDYYVKLVLISPTGEIVKEVDSNMLNWLICL